jgi:hypothetical protein
MMDGLPNGLRGFVAGFRHGWATAGEQQGSPARKPLSDDLKETAAGRGHSILNVVLGLLFYGFIGYLVFLIRGDAGSAIRSGYEGFVSMGWITPSHDTPVWIQGDWMVGEYRDCGMLTTTPPQGVTLSPQVRAQLPRLFCGEPTESAADFVRNFVSDPRLGQQLGQLGSKGSMDSPAEFAHQFLSGSDLLSFSNATNALFYGGDWSVFDNKFHVLPVLYHGRIDRSDAVFVSWRCQRMSESLECKALN